jgi:hypothetical protein
MANNSLLLNSSACGFATMDLKQSRALRAKIFDEQDRGNDHPTGRPGGPAGSIKRKGRPTGAAATMRRLRREHPELHALVMSGHITPARAAVVAGYRGKPGRHTSPPVSDINKTQEMELWLSNAGKTSAFTDDNERRRAWFRHRTRLSELFASPGRRMWAWWRFESKIKYPGFNLERSTLWEANLLKPAERVELEREWRTEFDRSLQPNFAFHDHGKILTGWQGHIAHLVFCDIPAPLAQQWADDDTVSSA